MTYDEKAGYKVGDRFICNNLADEYNDEGFTEGCYVTLRRDDGSDCPLFENTDGDTYYLCLYEVELVK
jgi:hypothetical protein